jgi:hypothetical protein
MLASAGAVRVARAPAALARSAAASAAAGIDLEQDGDALDLGNPRGTPRHSAHAATQTRREDSRRRAPFQIRGRSRSGY